MDARPDATENPESVTWDEAAAARATFGTSVTVMRLAPPGRVEPCEEVATGNMYPYTWSTVSVLVGDESGPLRAVQFSRHKWPGD